MSFTCCSILLNTQAEIAALVESHTTATIEWRRTIDKREREAGDALSDQRIQLQVSYELSERQLRIQFEQVCFDAFF